MDEDVSSERSGTPLSSSLSTLAALLPVLFLIVILAQVSGGGLGPDPLETRGRPLDPKTLIPRHRDALASRPPHGLALGLYSMDPGFDYGPSLTEIAASGAHAVELVVDYFQEAHDSSDVNVSDPRVVPWRRVERTIEQAHSLGLSVHLMPIVLIRSPRPQDWRGTIEPIDRDRWHRSYRVWLVEIARRAERASVEALCIGSEFNSLQGDPKPWLETIGRVREVYSGAVTYSANWDSFSDVSFLDALDAIGMTTYHPLATSTDPTIDELVNAWLPVRSKLIRWQESHGIPMFFTEVGYPSVDGAAMHPWDYTAEGPVDELEQFDCLTAFQAVWSDVEQLGGVFFFVWWGHGGPLDRGYTPRGKKGLEVVERWFRKHPAAATGPLSPSAGFPLEKD